MRMVEVVLVSCIGLVSDPAERTTRRGAGARGTEMTIQQRPTLKDFMHYATIAERDIEQLEAARDRWRFQFGQEAARLRKAIAMTQTEMARRLGCSKAMLHDFEHGRRWSDRIANELRARLEPSGLTTPVVEARTSSVEPSRIPCFAR